MRAPRVQARQSMADFPPELADQASSDPLEAQDIAQALNRLAAAFEAGTEAIRPAAETVHGFGVRLDALCHWLSGRWPWVIIVVVATIWKVVQVAPDQLPKIAAAILQALAT